MGGTLLRQRAGLRGLARAVGPCDPIPGNAGLRTRARVRLNPYPGGLTDSQLIFDVQDYLGRVWPGPLVPTYAIRAWEHFWPLADKLIRSTLSQRGIRGTDLDDQSQEVWLVLRRVLPTFRPDHSAAVVVLIKRIGERRAARFWRDRQRRREESTLPETLDAVPASIPEPASLAQQREHAAELRVAIAAFLRTVSRKNRRVFREYVMENQAAKEVAAALDMNVDAVRHRARRLCTRFAAKLKVGGDEQRFGPDGPG